MSDHLLSYSMSGRLSSYSIPVHAGASVHVRLVDNTSYLSVLDLIMCACQTESVQARAIWKSVPKEQLAGTLISFPGPLLATTITLAGALKLLGILLPGSCPARERVEAIITAYVTRISEEPNETAQVVAPAVPNGPAQAVEAESSEVPNEPAQAGSSKVSNEPAQVCTREALEGQHVEDTRKRKREELENLKADAELCFSIIEQYSSVMDKFASITDTYTALCLNPHIDDRAKAIFKEMLLRTV